jgi:uncharacterized protein YcfJ
MAWVLAAGLAATGAAQAQASWQGHDADYDWARVVSVEPIFERYEQPISRDVCWNERVQPAARYAYGDDPYAARYDDGAAGTVLGALVGGALGNQVGGGDGRRAATVAGAVIGGVIGNNIDRGRNWYGRDPYAYGQGYGRGGRYAYAQPLTQRVCDQRVEYRSEQRVVGYDVAYVYNGRRFRTETREHPGDRIRVAVNVAPVGY